MTLETEITQLILNAPRAQPLPQRSALDIKIDDAHHRLIFASSIDSKLVWARRLVGFRKQRALVLAQ